MSDRIAVFIDADNINYKNLGIILDEIKNYGNIIINRAYGDWSKLELFKKKSIEYGIELIQANSISGKNSSDIKLCVDAMNILYTLNEISMYYIVTSDSDFIHLVPYIKCLNKEVRCIGNQSTNKGLQNIVNKFTNIEVIQNNIDNEDLQDESNTTSSQHINVDNKYVTEISINHNTECEEDKQNESNLLCFKNLDNILKNHNNKLKKYIKKNPTLEEKLKKINKEIILIFNNIETKYLNMSFINDRLQRKYQFDYREYKCNSMTEFINKFYKHFTKTIKNGKIYFK